MLTFPGIKLGKGNFVARFTRFLQIIIKVPIQDMIHIEIDAALALF